MASNTNTRKLLFEWYIGKRSARHAAKTNSQEAAESGINVTLHGLTPDTAKLQNAESAPNAAQAMKQNDSITVQTSTLLDGRPASAGLSPNIVDGDEERNSALQKEINEQQRRQAQEQAEQLQHEQQLLYELQQQQLVDKLEQRAAEERKARADGPRQSSVNASHVASSHDQQQANTMNNPMGDITLPFDDDNVHNGIHSSSQYNFHDMENSGGGRRDPYMDGRWRSSTPNVTRGRGRGRPMPRTSVFKQAANSPNQGRPPVTVENTPYIRVHDSDTGGFTGNYCDYKMEQATGWLYADIGKVLDHEFKNHGGVVYDDERLRIPLEQPKGRCLMAVDPTQRTWLLSLWPKAVEHVLQNVGIGPAPRDKGQGPSMEPARQTGCNATSYVPQDLGRSTGFDARTLAENQYRDPRTESNNNDAPGNYSGGMAGYPRTAQSQGRPQPNPGYFQGGHDAGGNRRQKLSLRGTSKLLRQTWTCHRLSAGTGFRPSKKQKPWPS